MGFFCKTKDRNYIINQSIVVYEFKCPGCGYMNDVLNTHGVIETVL